MGLQVTVVIPNWNTRRWLEGALGGLRQQTYRSFRVILVDNGSTDDSVEFVRLHYPEVQVIRFPENRGFAAAVNAGIQRAGTPYVALLNADTIPRPRWLESLVAMIERAPDVGSVASRMLSMADPSRIDDAGDTFSWYGSARKRGHGEPAERYHKPEEVLSACAGAALYRRDVVVEVGGFDEGFISYLEDIDLGLRLRLKGYRCLYAPAAEVLHWGHGANLARPRYVYLMTRNRLAILTKDIPLSLLLRHKWQIVYGQLYFFLVYKHPWQSLRGFFSWLRALPRLLEARQHVMATRTIADDQLARWISDELGEPSLSEIVRSKLPHR